MTNHPDAIVVQADCDLSIRRGRFNFYAIVPNRTKELTVLRLTDFKSTIDIALPNAVAKALAQVLSVQDTDEGPGDSAEAAPCAKENTR